MKKYDRDYLELMQRNMQLERIIEKIAVGIGLTAKEERMIRDLVGDRK
jgi:hypothetical protein